MNERMKIFIEKNDILFSSQHGIRRAHPTQHKILNIVNTTQSFMDKKLFSGGGFVHVDIKTVLDTVDHTILLNKLNHHSFRGIIKKWFSSYFHGRTQSTQIGPRISNKMTTTCGVTQCSVLGPLLFLLYINDIQNCFDL